MYNPLHAIMSKKLAKIIAFGPMVAYIVEFDQYAPNRFALNLEASYRIKFHLFKIPKIQ